MEFTVADLSPAPRRSCASESERSIRAGAIGPALGRRELSTLGFVPARPPHRSGARRLGNRNNLPTHSPGVAANQEAAETFTADVLADGAYRRAKRH
jgi:hypothetical protein